MELGNCEVALYHHEFKPWRYAETWDKRVGGSHWGAKNERKFMSDAYWLAPLKWDRAAEKAGERKRVFCASMADVFEVLPGEHPSSDQQAKEQIRLFGLIHKTPHLDWLLLTKRPENIVGSIGFAAQFISNFGYGDTEFLQWLNDWAQGKPPSNVWLGTSIEDERVLFRREALVAAPAVVRFLSLEPLLGPLDNLSLEGIDWVIVGGESGPHARPMHPEWARGLRDQCQAANVPYLFKQWGEWSWDHPMSQMEYERGESMYKPGHFLRISDTHAQIKIGKKAAGRILDGRTWDEFPAPRS